MSTSDIETIMMLRRMSALGVPLDRLPVATQNPREMYEVRVRELRERSQKIMVRKAYVDMEKYFSEVPLNQLSRSECEGNVTGAGINQT